MKKEISNQRFGEERALYGTQNLIIKNCQFAGEEDGESALKEAQDILVDSCLFDLRYPFWHNQNIQIVSSQMTHNCRAALWYSNHIAILNSQLHGIKALRESKDIQLINCQIVSPEFSWRCSQIDIKDCALESEYAFFESKNINIDNLTFTGKYSFQYVNKMNLKNSHLKTKDAFWHTKNVIVTDTILEGEYLGWYSTNLTLIRCHIKGTQPLCYCTNLKLIDCTMEETDLSFEKSSIHATILGSIDSIKNPTKGKIVVDECKELIIEDKKSKANIQINKK